MIDIQQQISELRNSIVQTTNFHPDQYLDISWPVGEKKLVKPTNRYDVMRYDLINTTHIFMRDDFRSATPLTTTERKDIEVPFDSKCIKFF